MTHRKILSRLTWDNIIGFTIYCFAVAIISLFFYCAVAAIFMRKDTGNCYISSPSLNLPHKAYIVRREVEWAEDPIIAESDDIDEANILMNKICK